MKMLNFIFQKQEIKPEKENISEQKKDKSPDKNEKKSYESKRPNKSEAKREQTSNHNGVYILIGFAIVSSVFAVALSVSCIAKSRDSQVLQSILQDNVFAAKVENIVSQYISINYPELQRLRR